MKAVVKMVGPDGDVRVIQSDDPRELKEMLKSLKKDLALELGDLKGFEIDIDKELAAFEANERARLGLNDDREQWTDAMIDPSIHGR